MMPNKDYILFLDLETTGSSLEEGDEIIEIGLVLLDAKTLEEVDTFTRVLWPSKYAFGRMLDNDVVFNMHNANNLINSAELFLRRGNEAPDVDLEISRWIGKHIKGNDHIPYGGSGVSHFDRKFIDKYLPRLSKRLTYWALDVGSARRVYSIAGGKDWPNQDGKTHRALDDARFHAQELRFLVGLFKAEIEYNEWLDYHGQART